MPNEQLAHEWRSGKLGVSVNPAMTFSPDGLVLGAGTVIVPMEGTRRLQSLQGQEARILALLSAFYDRPTALSALGNIERAAKAWSEGDASLACIYLAHACFFTAA